jgi:hypothetical protein
VLPGTANYFIGNDPTRWHTGIPTYREVEYRDVYQGIDLTFSGTHGQLEYGLRVAPGAVLSAFAMVVSGADDVFVNGEGDLILRLGDSTIRQSKPQAWQLIGASRRSVDAAFALSDRGRISIRVSNYDPRRGLIIDPKLVYSTYLGGSGRDEGFGIAVDPSGSAYVTGSTTSTNFPNRTHEGGFAGDHDAFVAKLAPTGNSLVYSAYLGGSGFDQGYGIAVDASGSAYVTGLTNSINFPIVNAYQGANAGEYDAFVAKIAPTATGSSLAYSTYLGGSALDYGLAIAVGSSGSSYATGFTYSSDFPTANPFQGANGGLDDAFVARFSAAGNSLVYSTYLGGNRYDDGFGIAVDQSGSAYVTGDTLSTNFPTVNPFQRMNAGRFDAFVAKFSAAGNSLVYSTYLGGTLDDYGFGIAVDPSRSVYVTGDTLSTNFPTVNPVQGENAGADDAFVARLASAGNSLVYSTYLGGSGIDEGRGIALDTSGSAYVTGQTGSADFPTVDPIQGENAGDWDAFVARLTSAGNSLVYSTYLGGSAADAGIGIAVDSSSSVYVTGLTGSTDFPTANAFQRAYAGGNGDAFLCKISSGATSRAEHGS